MSRPSHSSTTSTTLPLPPTLMTLSQPANHQVANQAHQFLLSQIVSTLRASAKVARERRDARELEMVREGLLPANALKKPSAAGGPSGVAGGQDDEDFRTRLEALGERVGGDLAERLTFGRPRFGEPLDVVKFICKDVWTAAFGKQVDNLRTNHRGVFVLQDALFPPISHISTHLGQAADLKASQIHLAFPQGLVRGALARLGLPGTVTAESSGLPQVTFTLKTTKLAPGP